MYHFQQPVTDWPQAVERLPDTALVKAVDRGDILRDVKGINPNITTTLRHWGGSQNIFGGTFEENKQRARDFFKTFIDATFKEQYAQYTDYVHDWNEYLSSSHTDEELQIRLTWARAVAEVWRDEYRTQPEYSHIRLALVNCPIGNDIHREFAEIALEYDCAISYHAYSHYINGQRDPGDWRYHSGRWNFMEQSWGLRPDWIFGESGPYAGVLEGWRHSSVLGGDINGYVNAVREWIRDIQTTEAYQQGRIEGFALFTTGGGSTWKYYETSQPELNLLADMINQEWKPGGEPVPEPRTWSKLVYLLPQNATREQYAAVADVAYPTRSEIAFSADSCFARPGNVTSHKAIVYDVASWGGASNLESWVNTHYNYDPPTEIEYRDYPSFF